MTHPEPNPYLPAPQREGQAPGGPGPGFHGAGGPLPTAPRPSQGLAVTSLVLGICAAVVAFAPFVNVLAVLAGIAAIICGIIALRRRLGRGMALGGIITGAVGIVVSLAMTALVLAMLHGIGEAFKNGTDGSAGRTQISVEVGDAPAAVHYVFRDKDGTHRTMHTVSSGDSVSRTLSTSAARGATVTVRSSDPAAEVSCDIVVSGKTADARSGVGSVECEYSSN